MDSDFLKIKDPSLPLQEILQKVEKKLPRPESGLEQVDFSPASPGSLRQFDPLAIAYSFEKGISPPKFTNPRLWMIKGPIKWILIWIVNLYSLIDKKLSENRIKAFFSVLHELGRIRSEIRLLQKEKLEQTNNSEIKIQPSYWFPTITGLYWDLLPNDTIQSKQILLLGYDGGLTKKLLLKDKLKSAWVTSAAILENFKNSVYPNTQLIDWSLNWDEELSEVIIEIPLQYLSADEIDFFFRYLKSIKKTRLDVRFIFKKVNSKFPFEGLNITSIRIEKLPDYFRPLDFEIQNILPLREDIYFVHLSIE